MIRAALVATFLASPVAAFDAMTPEVCQTAWDALIRIVPFDGDDKDDLRAIRLSISSDGWCRLRGGAMGLEDADFTTLDWQAEGVARMMSDDVPPSALRLRIADVKGDDRQVTSDVNITLRHDQAERRLVIEEFEMIGDNEGALNLTAVINFVDFSSFGTAAMSLGGASLTALASNMKVNGARDVLGLREVKRDLRTMIADATRLLDPQIVSRDSARDAAAFLMSDNSGELSVSFSSERGLGFLSFFGGIWVEDLQSDEGMADAIDLMLDGARVTVAWTPDT